MRLEDGAGENHRQLPRRETRPGISSRIWQAAAPTCAAVSPTEASHSEPNPPSPPARRRSLHPPRRPPSHYLFFSDHHCDTNCRLPRDAHRRRFAFFSFRSSSERRPTFVSHRHRYGLRPAPVPRPRRQRRPLSHRNLRQSPCLKSRPEIPRVLLLLLLLLPRPTPAHHRAWNGIRPRPCIVITRAPTVPQKRQPARTWNGKHRSVGQTVSKTDHLR